MAVNVQLLVSSFFGNCDNGNTGNYQQIFKISKKTLKKISLQYIIALKRYHAEAYNEGGAHLRGLAPGQHNFELRKPQQP